METELATAERQGNEAPRRDGIVLVVNAEGEVVRRGVGKPPWRSSKNRRRPEVVESNRCPPPAAPDPQAPPPWIVPRNVRRAW